MRFEVLGVTCQKSKNLVCYCCVSTSHLVGRGRKVRQGRMWLAVVRGGRIK